MLLAPLNSVALRWLHGLRAVSYLKRLRSAPFTCRTFSYFYVEKRGPRGWFQKGGRSFAAYQYTLLITHAHHGGIFQRRRQWLVLHGRFRSVSVASLGQPACCCGQPPRRRSNA